MKPGAAKAKPPHILQGKQSWLAGSLLVPEPGRTDHATEDWLCTDLDLGLQWLMTSTAFLKLRRRHFRGP